MEKRKRIEKYIPLLKFIAEIVGDNCEVVLHDITNPENSIIAIENGYISGRKVGDSLTDFVLKVLKDESYKDQDYICNYRALGAKGNAFRSSSLFIKNEENEIIGMLCVNIDVSQWMDVKDLVSKMIGFKTNIVEADYNYQEKKQVFENLNGNVDSVLKTMIKNILNQYDTSPNRMSVDEKIEVVRSLNEQGAFLLKGGVSEVAKNLKVSEPTIYRYISKVK